MYKYEVTYWSEGGGPGGSSDYVVVLVAAKNMKAAIAHVIKNHGVYTADQPNVKAKRVKGTVEAFDIGLGYVART
jgi:hypothetical protein